MAQTPNRMRGIMMGLVITMMGWATSGSSLFAKYSICSKSLKYSDSTST